MLNRLLKIIHWILYGLVLLSIFSVILTLIEKELVDQTTENVFRYSIMALAFYIGILWVIKRHGIYVPWQHDSN